MPSSPKVCRRCLEGSQLLGLEGETYCLFEEVQQVQTTKEYECLKAHVFASYLILDLYDEDSSLQANINRMTVSLEVAANELLYVSKRIKALRYKENLRKVLCGSRRRISITN